VDAGRVVDRRIRRSRLPFSDYGMRADVARPPADQVVEEDNPSFLTQTLLP
jgi:hypothetical protein